MLCVLILAAPRLFSPALPPSLRQTLWALSSAAVKPATLTPRAVLPLLEANAWTDMKRKLQQLQLPAAEEASLEAHLAERFATPQRRRRLAERKPFEAHLHATRTTAVPSSTRAAAAARTNVRKSSAEHVDRKLPRKNVTRRCQ